MSYNFAVQCLFTHPNWVYSWAQTHTVPALSLILRTFTTVPVNGRKRLFRVELRKLLAHMLVFLLQRLQPHSRRAYLLTLLVKASLAVYYSCGQISVSSVFHFQN